MQNKFFSKYRAIFFGAVFLFIFLIVGGFMYTLPPERRPGFLPDLPGMPKPSTGVTITFWSVYDDSSVYEDLIKRYEEATGHNIEYRKFANATELEKALYNNLASKTGPDIFSLHNTWMPRYYGKVAPLPAEKIDEIKSPLRVMRVSFGKDDVGDLAGEFAQQALFFLAELFQQGVVFAALLSKEIRDLLVGPFHDSQ